MRNLKQIRKIGASKYVTLPKEWGCIDDYIDFEIMDDSELRLRIMTVRVIPKGE